MNKVNAEELMTIRRNLNYATTKKLKNLYCYDRRERPTLAVVTCRVSRGLFTSWPRRVNSRLAIEGGQCGGCGTTSGGRGDDG